MGKYWHIDHIKPLKFIENGVKPSIEELKKRLHYTNTQPLWAEENISKRITAIFFIFYISFKDTKGGKKKPIYSDRFF